MQRKGIFLELSKVQKLRSYVLTPFVHAHEFLVEFRGSSPKWAHFLDHILTLHTVCAMPGRHPNMELNGTSALMPVQNHGMWTATRVLEIVLRR
jgi:hypothetical protein